MKKLYGLPEAAQLLSVSAWVLRRHIAAGSVKAVHVGTRVLVSETELTKIQKRGLPSINTKKDKDKAA